MRHSKVPILCTRPLRHELVSMAEQNGFTIHVVPFISTEKLQSEEVQNRIKDLSRRSVTVIFTSMNAAEAVITELKLLKPSWDIYCIGNTTRQILVEYFGQDTIAGFAGTAAHLARNIVKAANESKVFFFCGDQRREELPEILSANGIQVEEIIVYKTIALKNKIDKSYYGILFFSPSAVTSFFSNNVPDKRTTLFAIGETTAGEIRKYSNNTVVVSEEPGKENLLRAMIEFYHLQSDKLPGAN